MCGLLYAAAVLPLAHGGQQQPEASTHGTSTSNSKSLSTRPDVRLHTLDLEEIVGQSPARGRHVMMGGCPESSCIGGNCVLTQSSDLASDDQNQVACGVTGVGTTASGWARCFNLLVEGVPNGGPLTVDRVTFGVQEATADGINVDVVLYVDCDACPPREPGIDALEIARESVVINSADAGSFLTVDFPTAPAVRAGANLVVEIEQVDDGLIAPEFAFRPISNAGGQCAPSYLRAPACGFQEWAELGALGFADRHLVLAVEGTVGGNFIDPCPAPPGPILILAPGPGPGPPPPPPPPRTKDKTGCAAAYAATSLGSPGRCPAGGGWRCARIWKGGTPGAVGVPIVSCPATSAGGGDSSSVTPWIMARWNALKGKLDVTSGFAPNGITLVHREGHRALYWSAVKDPLVFEDWDDTRDLEVELTFDATSFLPISTLTHEYSSSRVVMRATTDLPGLEELFEMRLTATHDTNDHSLDIEFTSNPALGLSDGNIQDTIANALFYDDTMQAYIVGGETTIVQLTVDVPTGFDTFEVGMEAGMAVETFEAGYTGPGPDEGYCGDGVVSPALDEQCDPPNACTCSDACELILGEACCLGDGGCEMMDPSCCLAQGGSPGGPGAACDGDGNANGFDDACEHACVGDFNNDGVVNAADLAILLGSWGPCEQCAADFNGDGVVNAADLALVLGSWGECPQSAVCGDGIVDEFEECDPPDNESCDESCLFIDPPPCSCGCDLNCDGITTDEELLECEDLCGPGGICGDGVVGEGEQCDPPDGVTCDDNCQIMTGACDYPDIRTIVADADLDPPDIQQNYDAINATLHLFGGMTFESFFFEPLDVLSSVALERVETLETCAGVPIDAAMVAAALEQIMAVGKGLPLVEVVASVPGELEVIKAAIDELRMQGIGFPPFATTDFDAELKLASILVLVDEAGVLEFGDLFFKDSSEVSEAQFVAITQANDEGGVLDFQVIDVENMASIKIIRNNHCCNRGVCEPGLLDYDRCNSMPNKWCCMPNAPPPLNCALCSINSKDC